MSFLPDGKDDSMNKDSKRFSMKMDLMVHFLNGIPDLM